MREGIFGGILGEILRGIFGSISDRVHEGILEKNREIVLKEFLEILIPGKSLRVFL